MTNPNDPQPGLDFSADEMGLLDQLLADAGVDVTETAAINRRLADTPTPLSFSQELLWLLDRATPGMVAYKLPIARRLVGVLDRRALERSLSTLAERHESLRTRFVATDGAPVQVIDAAAPLALPIVDLRNEPDPESAAHRSIAELGARPFDLATEHMFRATLLQLGDADHVLLIDTHHIVMDGVSLEILFRELGHCYVAYHDGAEPGLPALPIQFGDFAAWQRDYLAGDRLATLLAFWRQQLASIDEPLNLPTDLPRAATPEFRGGRARALIAPGDLHALKEFGRSRDATLYMVLLAGYMTVLHRYSGAANVLVGSGSAGRLQAELDGMIGYLNNTLVQRGDFTNNPTFVELLGQVRESALGAYDHQDIPLEKLVMELRSGQGRLSEAPLFNTVLTMQGAAESSAALAGLELRPFGANSGTTKFDLTLLPAEREDGLHLTLQYRSDLYQSATAQRFLGHFVTVLRGALANPATPISQLPLLTDQEIAQLDGWNATAVDFRGAAAAHHQFERAAVRSPDAAAVVCGEESISYCDLDRRANRLAHRLHALGVARGNAVGIALDRSVDAIAALLGVIKAGGCYVPLATDAPAARIAQQLAESGVRHVITRSTYAHLIPANATIVALDADAATIAALSPESPGIESSGADVAYVLFTSGSTGVPKGVAVTHANLANYTAAVGRVFGPATTPRQFATVSTLSADLGNTAIFPALTTGGTLHVLPNDIALDGPRFAAYAAAHPIDVLKITPSHLRALLGAAGPAASTLLPREWLVVGGEACPWELVEEVRRIGECKVLNHYGPTETTVGASTFVAAQRDVEPLSATVPIGFPLANVQLHVLDAARQRAPIGIPGELWIGGAGVAQGYVNRPDLTAERFVDVAGLGRLYRTGDRVRRLPDGAIEFLGRGDGQVKVRGFRVELGEIEQVIAQLPGVDRAVVSLGAPTGATGNTAVDESLFAWVVPKKAGYSAAHAARPTEESVRAWVTARLPDYMTPTAVVILDELPLNANGKLDRRALPIPGVGAAAAREVVAPRTDTERALVAIWSEALKRDEVGIRDNFFELGGHSLIAIRVLGKVSRTLGVRLSLRALFEAPTIEHLARLVDRTAGDGAATAAAIVPVKRAPRPSGAS